MQNKDLLERKGKRVVFLGNEAIARGALEAGVAVVAVYPGTPSSEVGIALSSVAKEAGIYYEWSTNEKVATEVVAGAAFSGVKSMTAMKHFGMNVASDSLLPLAYTGVRGAMVVLVADDPQGHSSAQSEQDSRFYARMGNFPVIEPSTVRECREFTIRAFEISEKYQIPVIIRTTTMVSHTMGDVVLGQLRKPVREGTFVKDPDRYMNLSPHLQVLHERVLKKMEAMEKEYGRLNTIEGTGKTGVITSGASYNYLKEINPPGVKIAKLNITHPISRSFVSGFLKGLEKVIVIEELEPVIESFVRSVALEANPKVRVYGKDVFPRIGEFNPEIVSAGLAKAGVKIKIPNYAEHQKNLEKIKILKRLPDFCQGCPHRFSYDTVKEALGENVVWAGDIGCYSMGIFEPYKMQDFVISMGASMGISHGIKKVSRQKVVAFIGDSTFFHAGMSGLANIVYNNSSPLIIILDNSITAMTGHQPNPGTGFNATWDVAGKINIEDVVRALGIKHVAVVDSMQKKKFKEIIKDFIKKDEPAVIISRHMCVLYRKKAIDKGLIKFKEGSE